MSSFGIGGTNAHVILQEAPAVKKSQRQNMAASHTLLYLSAPDEESLGRQCDTLAEHLERYPEQEISAVGYTLMCSRHRYAYQRIVLGKDRAALAAQLRKPCSGQVLPSEPIATAFMFPGQGAQIVGMNRYLYDSEPIFRRCADECLDLLDSELNGELRRCDLLAHSDQIHETHITQVALFIHEYALAQWYLSHGVVPAALIGHSLGEYVAACIAGVFSLEDALLLMVKRGQLLSGTEPGGMLAVPLSASTIGPLLIPLGLDLAVINETNSCVVSGELPALQKLCDQLETQGVAYRYLKVSRAFHSRLIDPVLESFRQELTSVHFSPPQIPFISNLTGEWADAVQVCQPEYWVQHMRDTVRFAAGLKTIFQTPLLAKAALIEVGPQQILTTLALRHQERASTIVIPSAPHKDPIDDAGVALQRVFGELYMLGVPLETGLFWGHQPEDRVLLPSYRFASQRYWLDPKVYNAQLTRSSAFADRQNELGLLREVSAVFEEVLGITAPDINTSFFALGGDSLNAIQLSSRLQRAVGVKVDLMALELPTIHRIAQSIEMKKRQHDLDAERDILVRLRKGVDATAAPLILIHPIGGDIYFYRDLLPGLDQQRAVYAIRSPMLAGLADFSSIEQMANDYLLRLTHLLGKRDYCLGGSSFGGIVAFEMMRQYNQKRGVYLPVIMVDSPCPGNLPAVMSDEEILDYLLSSGTVSLDIDQRRWHSLVNIKEKIYYLAELTKGTAMEVLFSEEFLPKYLDIWKRHNEIMPHYQPSAMPCDVLFFTHSDPISNFPENQEQHWKRFITGNFEVIKSNGNHLTMNCGKNAVTIAQEITIWLNSRVESPRVPRRLFF